MTETDPHAGCDPLVCAIAARAHTATHHDYEFVPGAPRWPRLRCRRCRLWKTTIADRLPCLVVQGQLADESGPFAPPVLSPPVPADVRPLGYLWRDPATGTEQIFSPAEVAVIYSEQIAGPAPQAVRLPEVVELLRTQAVDKDEHITWLRAANNSLQVRISQLDTTVERVCADRLAMVKQRDQARRELDQARAGGYEVKPGPNGIPMRRTVGQWEPIPADQQEAQS